MHVIDLCYSVREVVRQWEYKSVRSIVVGEGQPHPLAMNATTGSDRLLSKPAGLRLVPVRTTKMMPNYGTLS
jgi:hypothetical protein